jgi:hypothetical protein
MICRYRKAKEVTMKTLKSLAIVFSLGLFLLPSSARADEWNKLTKITFSGPVQVADTQLPAGTYTFKLMDDQGDRHIVQIFNNDETHLIATILAMPDYRLKPTGNTSVKFAESGEGSQAEGNIPDSGLPMKEWFYPGDSFGQEFRVVPQQVASVQPEHAPVAAEAPAPPAESPKEPAPDAEAAAAPIAAEPSAGPAPQEAPAPSPPAEQAAPEADQQSAPDNLPQTASQTPLVALIGFLALGAAACLRIMLKIKA